MEEVDSLLFSGGGMRGIAYVGVFKTLRKFFKKDQIKRVCGVSIGSVFCIFWILGYTYKELKEEILLKNFRELNAIKVANLSKDWGLDNGNGLRNWLETFFIKKGVDPKITFKEFGEKFKDVSLNIISTNLNKMELALFNDETTPDLSVIDASLMSMSIPFLFTCKKYNDQIYVDGAVLSNLPIKFFMEKCGIENEKKLLSIKLLSKEVFIEIRDLKSYISALGKCYSKNVGAEKCENLLEIDITGMSHIDFDMKKEIKRNFIKIGIRDSKSFFDCAKKK